MRYCPTCHRTYPTDYNVCPADQSALQSAHELQTGMVIRNKYEILERIGIGGMGFVYRGRHITFNEVCAIKIVNDVIAGDANFLQRFQTEAVVTRKLRHPNAVRVDDFDYTEDGRPFIVMELVQGKDVGEILQSEGPLSVPRAVGVATQVAQALGFAHKLGIVHRDIKPGNIILTTNEQGQETAKVLDFGIAKLREAVEGAKPGMTMTGMVVGTPLYMSPEQFMGKKAGQEIDGRTDLYSLGVVLYQMVTAQLPFEGDTLYSLMMQHMEGNVRPPHELVPELEIPESLSHVILKAIDKDRDQRFQTAEEFVAALAPMWGEPFGSGPVSGRAVVGVVVAPPPPLSQPPLASSPASASQTPSSQGSLPRGSQVTPVLAHRGSAVAGNLTTEPPSAVPPQAPPTAPLPVRAQPSAPGVKGGQAQDSQFVKSAEQHLFLQPRKFRLKNLIVILVLFLAGALVAGVGYLKYQAIQRDKIESSVTGQLNAAPSATLRAAGIRVFVSDKHEVTLDGIVRSQEDFNLSESLARSVPGVTHVNNRVRVVPSAQPGGQMGGQTESSESLMNRGTAFLDAGDYASAIDCFRKAAADPNNKGAQELLDRAHRAQQTEEKLLRNRK
jgi:serine/threonine protein kinase